MQPNSVLQDYEDFNAINAQNGKVSPSLFMYDSSLTSEGTGRSLVGVIHEAAPR
jgi:hypothetical protein